jgi:hypothetical protein
MSNTTVLWIISPALIRWTLSGHEGERRAILTRLDKEQWLERSGSKEPFLNFSSVEPRLITMTWKVRDQRAILTRLDKKQRLDMSGSKEPFWNFTSADNETTFEISHKPGSKCYKLRQNPVSKYHNPASKLYFHKSRWKFSITFYIFCIIFSITFNNFQ